MRNKALLGAGVLLAIVVVPIVVARGDLFHVKLSRDKKVLHALDRLTFGPRPGDARRVRALGLKKWIDLQLHPDRIPENPVLEARLRPLETLRMSAGEMAKNYPPPQVIRAMAEGRLPLPADPEQRKTLERLAERFKRRLNSDNKPMDRPQFEEIAKIVGRDQLRTLRNGTPEERLQVFFSLPTEQQDAVMGLIPQNARREILARAPTEVRRRMLGLFIPQEVVAQDLMEAKVYRVVYSNRQLGEVLADFWYNHFNVYFEKGADRYLVTSYERDAIRPHVLGKFRDMLRATAEHPAMLFYLDNWQSVDPAAARRVGARRGLPQAKARRGLNENYARELLELHTLGVDSGYTQKDIVEVARCFTGWTIRDPRGGGGFFFDRRMHDPGEKTVLGVKIAAGGGVEDGLKVLDILAMHPSTARFISTKLAQRFAADTPPPSLIQRMVKTFASTGGDLRAVMETMLASGEFWSQGAYRAKVKSPLELVASAVRALDAEVDFAFSLANQVAQLGQPLYRKQEPTGYSNSGEEWINSAGLLARMNFAQALASGKVPGARVDASRLGTQPEAIARTLLLRDASAQTRSAIEGGLRDQQQASPSLIAGLVLGSPDFQRR